MKSIRGWGEKGNHNSVEANVKTKPDFKIFFLTLSVVLVMYGSVENRKRNHLIILLPKLSRMF